MDKINLPHFLLESIVDRVNSGVVVVDKEYTVVVWNRFMETHSQKNAASVVGKNLFDCFPELPKPWLSRKIHSVFILNNFAFTSWEHRPYLFRFDHHRPLSGEVNYMFQDCTFLPVKNTEGEVEYVCITITDATDTYLYQKKLHETLEKLERLSQQDGLTGLNNRRQLEKHLKREFDRAKRYNQDLAFAMFDLDFFKKVNDTYGHLAGDEVLRHVALQTLNSMRITDITARYGGEEFAIILQNTNLNPAKIALERLRATISENPIQFQNQSIPVTISIGLTQLHPGIETHHDLIHEADSALYQAKENGRNQVVIFSA